MTGGIFGMVGELAKDAALVGYLVELDDLAYALHTVHLVPILAVHGAVLAVDHDHVRLVVQVDRVQTDHVVEAQLCARQVDQVHDVGHNVGLVVGGVIVVELLEVEYVLVDAHLEDDIVESWRRSRRWLRRRKNGVGRDGGHGAHDWRWRQVAATAGAAGHIGHRARQRVEKATVAEALEIHQHPYVHEHQHDVRQEADNSTMNHLAISVLTSSCTLFLFPSSLQHTTEKQHTSMSIIYYIYVVTQER